MPAINWFAGGWIACGALVVAMEGRALTAIICLILALINCGYAYANQKEKCERL
jgi:hypothetical protein